MKTEKIIAMVMAEVERAETTHPHWPWNNIHAGAIVGEEAGELIKAILDHDEKKGTQTAILTEAVQTAASAIRFLKNFNLENKNE